MNDVTSEKAVKPVNYSPELTAKVQELYAAGETIKAIAEAVDRTEKSVRGKLVSLKVYKAVPKAIKTNKDEGPSKKDQLKVLEGLGFSAEALEGLKNATKPALAEVIERSNVTASEAA